MGCVVNSIHTDNLAVSVVRNQWTMPFAGRTIDAGSICLPVAGSNTLRTTSALDFSVTRKTTTLAELIKLRVKVIR